MTRYIVGRIAGLGFVMVAVTFLTFGLMFNAPGGPWDELNQPLSPEARANMIHKYGLDKPFWANWWEWSTKAIKGDFGDSYYYPKTRVIDLFQKYWGSSLMLGAMAVGWSFPVGVLLGIIAALKRNTIIDQIITTISLITVTVPIISIIFICVVVFIIQLKWFGFNNGQALYTQPPSLWVLPVFIFGLGTVGALTRYTRSGMLDVLGQDYIRTARAKGLERVMVIGKHAMRNMLIPLVTIFGPVLANAVTGSTFVEFAFAIPGIGRFFLESVFTRDYPVIIFTVVITAGVLSVSNLFIDIAYTLIDPRIRLGGQK